MKLTRFTGPVALAAVAALALSACATNEAQAGTETTKPDSSISGTLNGIGSSAQSTAQTTWAAGFQDANAKVTLNYDPQGSGAGRKAFLGGAADFAGSDAALKTEELATESPVCAPGTSPIDLPVYISPIAIAYNLPDVKEMKLDAATIAGIFKGEITTWNDPKIAQQNKGEKLPEAAITVVRRSDDSGTTQNFTEYLAANAKDVWDAAPSQTFPYPIGDAAKGTSGVADATRNAANSITYIDESGAGQLQVAQLKVGDEYTKISAEGAAAVVAESPIADDREENDLAISIDRTITKKGAWPLVLVSYVITCQQYADADKGALVKEYVTYMASDEGQKAAAEQAGSAPLATSLADKVRAAAASIR